jgi:hypothetical protein
MPMVTETRTALFGTNGIVENYPSTRSHATCPHASSNAVAPIRPWSPPVAHHTPVRSRGRRCPIHSHIRAKSRTRRHKWVGRRADRNILEPCHNLSVLKRYRSHPSHDSKDVVVHRVHNHLVLDWIFAGRRRERLHVQLNVLHARHVARTGRLMMPGLKGERVRVHARPVVAQAMLQWLD